MYQSSKTADGSAEDYRDNRFLTSRGETVNHDSARHLLHFLNETFRDNANSFFAKTERSGGTEDANHPGVTQDGNGITSGKKLSLSGTWTGPNPASVELKATTSQNDGEQNFNGTEVEHSVYTIDYSGCGFNGSGDHHTTFVDLLKKTREKILAVGEEPEEIKLAVLK